MKRIHKYRLNITDVQTLHLSKGAQILSVQEQSGGLCLWVLVDLDKDLEPREIHIIRTGHPVPDVPLTFICTAQLGWFVWHIFEAVKK
jgi:hypothetical protein